MVDPVFNPSHLSQRRKRLPLLAIFLLAACSAEPQQRTLMGELGADLGASFGTPENLLILGGGLAAGMLLDSSTGGDAEDRTASFFDNNDVIPDSFGHQLDTLGSGLFLLGASSAWYGGARYWGNKRDEEASLAMLSALSITGVTTLGLKSIFNDGRPNDAPGGYPSGHSSMAMAAAATLGESYGWEVGLPAYLAAVAVGVQRLDSRKHDLDDIVGGFALGYVIGSSVAGRRLLRILGAELTPIIDPIGGELGLVMVWDF